MKAHHSRHKSSPWDVPVKTPCLFTINLLKINTDLQTHSKSLKPFLKLVLNIKVVYLHPIYILAGISLIIHQSFPKKEQSHLHVVRRSHFLPPSLLPNPFLPFVHFSCSPPPSNSIACRAGCIVFSFVQDDVGQVWSFGHSRPRFMTCGWRH